MSHITWQEYYWQVPRLIKKEFLSFFLVRVPVSFFELKDIDDTGAFWLFCHRCQSCRHRKIRSPSMLHCWNVYLKSIAFILKLLFWRWWPSSKHMLSKLRVLFDALSKKPAYANEIRVTISLKTFLTYRCRSTGCQRGQPWCRLATLGMSRGGGGRLRGCATWQGNTENQPFLISRENYWGDATWYLTWFFAQLTFPN